MGQSKNKGGDVKYAKRRETAAREPETATLDGGLFEDGSDGEDSPDLPPEKTRPGAKPQVPSSPEPPRRSTPKGRFQGQLSVERGAVFLVAGGLRAEVLLCDARPEGGALSRERARAVAELRGLDRAAVELSGVQDGDMIVSARPVVLTATATSQYRGGARRERFNDVWSAIRGAREDLLSRSGVLSVRPGFKFEKGWITKVPAIVVTVLRKLEKGNLRDGEVLPETIDGVPVDVRQATPHEQLAWSRSDGGPTTPESAFVPGWELDRGAAMTPETGDLVAEVDPYIPPPDARLDLVTAPMTVICHVSPDRGFPTLNEMLQTVRDRLVIGMYDFTAPHILEAVKSALSQSTGGLLLVLDPKIALPAPNDTRSTKAGDYTEDQVIEDLADFLGDDWFQHRWASVKLKNRTTGGIYPSAYHIKVAVADGRALWLSSGNWQSSNQPDLDCTGRDAGRTDVLGKYNREWHVIVEHAGLASTFERFLQHDYEQAGDYQPEAAEALPDLFVPLALLRDRREAPESADLDAERGELPTYFAPKKFVFRGRKKLAVQPLLTPDNFAPLVLAELEKAERSILFQNQSLSIGKRPRAELLALVDALRRKQDKGLDVRIIFRSFGFESDDRESLEALQDRGFDMTRVKLQKNCHTKGILIDDRVTILGSHNWTSQGVAQNRDASFIFYSPEITAYYRAVFEHDYRVLARSKVPSEDPELAVLVAGDGPTPEGYVRMRWDHFYTD